ncbi:MAG: response regulator [Caulobacter sp.]|jgi:CheY-like chemotaxis protein
MARAIMLPSARINLEKLVVLLVDDNPQSLDILAQVVTGFGVRSIIRSPGGEDARAQLTRDQYDLVITDAQMPGLDGYALTSWIRREAPGQNRFVPVILVTAHTRKTHVTRARDCGANYAITKPIRPKTVLERIYWIAKEDRMFIEVDTYAGPDRRFRREGPPAGIDGRRAEDLSTQLGEATSPNLSQDQINAMMKPTKVAL